MAKQSNQKLKLLYLLRILLEQTDENFGLTITQLSAELAKYNVSAARKSLYDDIESLRLFGIDVCIKRDRYVKYYIAKRDLSVSELKYAVDALSKFDAISPSVSYELVQKLMRIYGGKRNSCSNDVEEPQYQTPKPICDSIAKNIEVLDSAISSKNKVCFRRFEWNSLKQRTLLDGGERLCVTPIKIMCNGKYVLYAFDGRDISSYEISNLLEVEVSSEDAVPFSEYAALLEAQRSDLDYENLRIEAANSFTGDIFTKFGLGVTVLSSRENTFEISVKVRVDSDLFAWLFKNAKYVRVISPQRVIDDYKDSLLLALDNVNKN